MLISKNQQEVKNRVHLKVTYKDSNDRVVHVHDENRNRDEE